MHPLGMRRALYDFVIRAATLFDPKTAQTVIRVRSAVDGPRRNLVVMPFEQAPFNGQVARPENNLDFYGLVEEFLAEHLGGRSEPWTKIDGTTAEVR